MDANEIINEVTEKIQKSANVKAAFGEPYEVGELTIIPVSKVSICGCGCGRPGKGEEEEGEKKKGIGMGLGLNVKTVPLGYIEIGEGSARYVEVTDQSRLVLAGAALGAFAVLSLTRLIYKLFKS